MKNSFSVQPIGTIEFHDGQFVIKLNDQYRQGLINIEGFSHLQITWWGHLYDGPQYRAHLVAPKPYKKGPDKLGIFATRSPVRPNPILITNIFVLRIDVEKGMIFTPYIDAEPGTPVLDIKPYHLSERVKNCQVPQWCAHWPQWDEDAADFDWQNEFNF